MNSAEFWMSFAFLFVFFVSFIPLKKYLSAWGEKRANQIKQELGNAKCLLKNASYLLEKSEKKLQNKEKESAAILQKATEKSSYLLYQTQLDCTQEYREKKAELAHRLSIVQKQAETSFNKKIIDLTLVLTKQSIRQKIKDPTFKKKVMQQDVNKFLSELDTYRDTFRKIILP